MANSRTWQRLISTGVKLVRAGVRARQSQQPKRRGSGTDSPRTTQGQRLGDHSTVEVDPREVTNLTLTYRPDSDGEADAGEIVWTWVPYVENDGRGKDRPVLVIARQDADRVYAVKLTSKDHDGDREYIPIGRGSWDSQGRESWVDVDQLYSVHSSGLRREGAALDADRFVQVAHVLQQRYGWLA